MLNRKIDNRIKGPLKVMTSHCHNVNNTNKQSKQQGYWCKPHHSVGFTLLCLLSNNHNSASSATRAKPHPLRYSAVILSTVLLTPTNKNVVFKLSLIPSKERRVLTGGTLAKFRPFHRDQARSLELF